MSDRFVHLHAASGYSLRYGASHPGALVERASDHGMGALALTDRDGVYGAVKFVKACMAADIRPILGVDLAVMPVCVPGSGAGRRAGRRTPARGGATVDPRHPRVTLLAQDPGGWAALCRLVSSTHLAGERGKPVTTVDLVADHARSGGMFVLLGPDSEVGRALAVRRPDLARAVLRRWRDAVAADDLLVEVVSHRGPEEGRYSSAHAARMFRFAQGEHLTAVLTNAVRYADRSGGPVADVLDAARRLVTLDVRHVDRVNAEGYLKSGKEMADIAEEVTRLSGAEEPVPLSGGGSGLLAATRRVAERCALDPRGGLGVGVPHFPELDVVRGASGRSPEAALRERCEAGLTWRGLPRSHEVVERLERELATIEGLGYPSYFLTVADIVALIRDMGTRCTARGSGAGSLVNYLLGVSGVDPLAHGLLMERFLSPLREALPDIDIDVESARRTEIYERILERYGGERCSCLSMMDTYRARHAVRDVGGALGMAPTEIDSIAKAFPHIRARDVRAALRELPELRASGISEERFDVFFRLVERLDGLPRHIALHPCGVLLSDATLLDRTPVEASWLGFPMSQFDKDDVEDLGFLKLDVLGVRMQSAMSHALKEVERVDGRQIDLDAVPRDDPATFRLVRSTRTLGCFQIESPGQRELLGKFGPETFDDLIIDISLFRPGPVKSDMVTPFLSARQGWEESRHHPSALSDVLRETHGVVVFHEQVLRIVAILTGCNLGEADEIRRALGEPDRQPRAETWFRTRARAQGYGPATIDQVWEVLKAFGSFGFCKAHAAAFALPTYHSAWLKAHHPAAFLAGVLTHDPGMYPKRLILDDARQFGIVILPLDVNDSDADYRVEKMGALDEPPPEVLGQSPRAAPEAGLPDGRAYGIRLGLSDVRGVSDGEVARVVAGQPYLSLSDFWHRTAVSRPVTERLVVAGGFDALYGIGSPVPVRRRGRLTRRDLLLQVGELDRWTRAARGPDRRRRSPGGRVRTDSHDVRTMAARQSRGASPVEPTHAQLALDLGDAPAESAGSGLPEMTGAERVRAELEVVGLDVSRHIVDFYTPVLDALGVTRSRELLHRRARTEILVAGVKVATQTPPVRSGRRVVFVTLDDATGPVDATFFEDAQGPYAATLFHGWLLLIRGYIRRTGPRGVSLRATGCWELPGLHEAWEAGGTAAVEELMDRPQVVTERAIHGAAQSHALNPVVARPVLVHPSGYRQSPYADTRPPGDDVKSAAPRKLWHSSQGSAGA
ncbi:MAG: DNA polymerase III subunit alpha [Carbonactinosporaceae bacterium]